jgi:hypothetical protein
MTEAEWLTSDDPMRMLRSMKILMEKAFETVLSDRKLRLFAVACCRRTLELVNQPVSECPGSDLWKDVLAAERIAEGLVQPNSILGHLIDSYTLYHGSKSPAERACHAGLSPSAWDAATGVIATLDDTSWDDGPTNCGATYLRELFGNPFRPVAADPSWQTDTVVLLARQMYESRDFTAMPILADALQDAECDNEDILSHCRDPKMAHVRGCWVVDAVLGKV